jgi:hypothetical protein
MTITEKLISVIHHLIQNNVDEETINNLLTILVNIHQQET